MTDTPIDVVAAGHLCLDIIPTLTSAHARVEDCFVPGGLAHVGPAQISLGGSVANTGIALHRLGARTRFVAKVGGDLLGKLILKLLTQYDPHAAETLIVAKGEATSYTIVINPPQIDRSFLHYSGTNDTFVATDVDGGSWRNCRILHFGYPPLMRAIAADGGHGLAEKCLDIQSAGTLVSLDMAMPGARGEAEPTNWRQWLRAVLPTVDLFMPSFGEIVLMLGGSHVEHGTITSAAQLTKVADELISLGVPIVVIKLGDQGLYLRTADHAENLCQRTAWRRFDWQAWKCRELWAPCFEVDVVGTTGAGDCTVAGFLMGLLQGESPETAIRCAAAVGALSVQSADATSNIAPWSSVTDWLQKSRPQRKLSFAMQGWRLCPKAHVYVGPADVTSPLGAR